jgi:hypothetical protein
MEAMSLGQLPRKTGESFQAGIFRRQNPYVEVAIMHLFAIIKLLAGNMAQTSIWKGTGT